MRVHRYVYPIFEVSSTMMSNSAVIVLNERIIHSH